MFIPYTGKVYYRMRIGSYVCYIRLVHLSILCRIMYVNSIRTKKKYKVSLTVLHKTVYGMLVAGNPYCTCNGLSCLHATYTYT